MATAPLYCNHGKERNSLGFCGSDKAKQKVKTWLVGVKHMAGFAIEFPEDVAQEGVSVYPACNPRCWASICTAGGDIVGYLYPGPVWGYNRGGF